MRSAAVLEKGLANDRRWMLVDENNVFLTQRQHPRLALFRMAIDNSTLRVSFDGDSCEIPHPSTLTSAPMEAQVWDDTVTVVEAGSSFHSWFSTRLGIPSKLVWFPEPNARSVDPDFAFRKENVSLADAFPVLVIGLASLNDLNSRLESPVPMNRFRPNFVIEGTNPYEEDGWKEFRVGNNRFRGVKNCSRCVTTTVDQDSGIKGREPLLTLSRYRKEGDKINFGRNAVAVDHYMVHEGDEIVLE